MAEPKRTGPEWGEHVPNFTFAMTENPHAHFEDFKGKALVLYFYPKDDTPGCTLEAQTFKEYYPRFTQEGIQVVGVSRDSIESHQRFQEKCELPFPLISDADGTLGKYFGALEEKEVDGKKVLSVKRSTFLIDRYGKFRQSWFNTKDIPDHVRIVWVTAEGMVSPLI